MKALISFLLGGAVLLPALNVLWADEPSPPTGVFPATRYEALWNKSPFSVATAEAAPDSPDYILYGIAQVEGVSYASLIDRQSQEHFLVSSAKANHGITLSSITEGKNGADTLAVIVKDGQPLTLKLEAMTAPPPTIPLAAPTGAAPAPSFAPSPQQIPMPGSTLNIPPSNRPLIRFHRPLIHLPTEPPGAAPAPAPAPPPSR